MKNRIVLLFFFTGLLFSAKSLAQCRAAGDWDGFVPFQGYYPTSNSIKISWATNSVYAKENFKIYKKHWLNDPWVLVASNIKNSYYEVTGLNYSTSYYFKVERYCSDGSYIDNFTTGGLTTKDQAYIPPSISYCFGYWYGYTSNTPSDNYIRVYWSHNATVDKDAKYIVYYRMNDFSSGTGSWLNSGFITGTDNYAATGLTKNTTYEFKIEKWCNNSLNPNISKVSISTTENPNSSYYIYGPVASVQNVGQTTANLTFANYSFHFPGTRLDAFKIYVSRNGGNWVYVGSENAVSLNVTQYSVNLGGLTPNSYYSLVVEQNYTLSPGESWENHHAVYSIVQHFKTDPYGPCGSLTGNFTIPWANVGVNTYSDATWLYSGTIFSTSNIILEAPITITFKATAVELKPGFITNTGSGAFKAVAFNPSTCATSRTAGTDSATGSALLPVIISSSAARQITLPLLPLQTEEEDKLSVYPNPASDRFSIYLSNSREIIRQVRLFDASGRQAAIFYNNSRNINVSSLAQGLYFYQIQTDKKIYTGKLQKQ
jgi:Secretion system C-terminal sorting domain